MAGRLRCPRCSTVFARRDESHNACPTCGFDGRSQGILGGHDPGRMYPGPGSPANVRAQQLRPPPSMVSVVGCFLLAVAVATNTVVAVTETTDALMAAVTGSLYLVAFGCFIIGGKANDAQRPYAVMASILLLLVIVLGRLAAARLDTTPTEDDLRAYILLGLMHDSVLALACLVALWPVGRLPERVISVCTLALVIIFGSLAVPAYERAVDQLDLTSGLADRALLLLRTMQVLGGIGFGAAAIVAGCLFLPRYAAPELGRGLSNLERAVYNSRAQKPHISARPAGAIIPGGGMGPRSALKSTQLVLKPKRTKK